MIGRGGSNIKNLERYSGTKILVNKPFVSVTVTGSQGKVKVAQALLLQQFKHFAATGAAIHIQTRACTSLLDFPVQQHI
eukprot:615900-Pelagomonas_calceolata.AAC.1